MIIDIKLHVSMWSYDI